MSSHLLKIMFEQQEYAALIHLAEKELRIPSDQVRHIVRQELIRRGLLLEVEHQFLPMQDDLFQLCGSSLD